MENYNKSFNSISNTELVFKAFSCYHDSYFICNIVYTRSMAKPGRSTNFKQKRKCRDYCESRLSSSC